MRKSKKYIKLKQLPTKPKAFSELISIVSSNVANAKIKRFVRDHYDHKLIYDSSIGLLRKKLHKAYEEDISIVDLLKGKKSHAVQLHKIEPIQLVNQELARMYRKSVTDTLSNSDERYIVQLLHCYMKSNYL